MTVVTKIHCNLCHSTCITKDTFKCHSEILRALFRPLDYRFGLAPCFLSVKGEAGYDRNRPNDQHAISFRQDTPCMRLKYRKALSESLACYGTQGLKNDSCGSFWDESQETRQLFPWGKWMHLFHAAILHCHHCHAMSCLSKMTSPCNLVYLVSTFSTFAFRWFSVLCFGNDLGSRSAARQLAALVRLWAL